MAYKKGARLLNDTLLFYMIAIYKIAIPTRRILQGWYTSEST